MAQRGRGRVHRGSGPTGSDSNGDDGGSTGPAPYTRGREAAGIHIDPYRIRLVNAAGLEGSAVVVLVEEEWVGCLLVVVEQLAPQYFPMACKILY